MASLNIGIIGAGIGGLAAAALLAQDGHRVVIAERFATPRPLGSGLVVQPVGLAVLDELGQGDAARALGAPIRRMRGWSVRAQDGVAPGRNALDAWYPASDPAFAMHRASLFHVLWQAMTVSQLQLITGETVIGADLRGGQRVLRG